MVVKIMVPFWVPSRIRHLVFALWYLYTDPKIAPLRNRNLYIYIYTYHTRTCSLWEVSQQPGQGFSREVDAHEQERSLARSRAFCQHMESGSSRSLKSITELELDFVGYIVRSQQAWVWWAPVPSFPVELICT